MVEKKLPMIDSDNSEFVESWKNLEFFAGMRHRESGCPHGIVREVS